MAPPAPPTPPVATFDLTPPPIAPTTSGSSASSGGAGRRLVFALLAALALVVGGFVAGNLLGDETQTAVESTAAVSNESGDGNSGETIDDIAAAPGETAPDETAPDELVDDQAAPSVNADESTTAPAASAPAAQPGPLTGDAIEPVTEVARAVGPAVVLIETTTGQGSGIIYSDTGLIVTNAHVVEDSTQVRVRLASGFLVEGEVLGADARRDVAVVKITTDAEFGVAVLAPQETVEVGQLAVAIGSPFGLEQTVTAGIVSATGRTFGGQGNPVEMIQTDAPINPGNSGGALADRQGRVVGMNTAIRTNGSSDNAGVGFAIPADTFKLISDRLVNGESLDSAYLGVELAPVLSGEPGALINNVLAGTGAETYGIEIGDLIVGFDGEAILSGGDLAAAVQITVPNTSVQIDVVRNGERLSFDVVLGTLDTFGDN